MQRLLLLLILMVFLSGLGQFLVQQSPKSTKTELSDKAISVPLMVAINILGLQDLIVRWLWIRFDLDALGFVRNYHRLLPYLDLITKIKPDEFHAWGLKTYMRLLRYQREGNSQRLIEDMQKLKDAAQKYPKNWRGHFEVAWMYAIFFKQPENSLPWANEALILDSNNETRELWNYVERLSKEEFERSNPGQIWINPYARWE